MSSRKRKPTRQDLEAEFIATHPQFSQNGTCRPDPELVTVSTQVVPNESQVEVLKHIRIYTSGTPERNH